MWKIINDFPSYEVSTEGEVRNRLTGKTLKPYSNRVQPGRGYLKVRLTSEPYKTKQVYVHRLVAEAFIPNPDNLPQVNHIDEDHENNKVENLEWCTHKYNVNYGTAQERHSATFKANRGKDVVKYDTDMNEIERFDSIVKAALSVENGNAQSLSVVLNQGGDTQTYKGYFWRFKDKLE